MNAINAPIYRRPHMEDVEDVENYAPGGYHPIDIGDVVGNGTQYYQVTHKLGYGRFSTVWLVSLCEDEHEHVPSHFALEILCADVPYIDQTLSIFEYLKTLPGPGHANVARMHDSFRIRGPNGEHHCLVFPVLGPSLQDPRVVNALSGPVRHDVCRQIASAIAFLHEHEIRHADLTISSVVFEIPDMQSMSLDRLCQLLGPIEAEDLRLPSGQWSPHGPRQVIRPPGFSGLDCSLLSRIRIVDFKQSFMEFNPNRLPMKNADFFPPEHCFDYEPSLKSDIWQLACLLYTVHGRGTTFLMSHSRHVLRVLWLDSQSLQNKHLLTNHVEVPLLPKTGKLEAHIDTVVAHLGPLPQEWKEGFKLSCCWRPSWETPLGSDPAWWSEDKQAENSIDSRLSRDAPHLTTHQTEEYIRLFYEMVAYEPASRPSAADVEQRLNSF